MKNHFLLTLLLLLVNTILHAQDTIAPVLNSISISRTTVQQGDTITVFADMTDDIAGINGPGFPGYIPALNGTEVRLMASSTGPYYQAYGAYWTHMQGNVYASIITIPIHAVPGDWYIESATLCDRASNIKYYPSFSGHFMVTGTGLSIPVIDSISLSPPVLHNDDTLTVYATVTDTAGISFVYSDIYAVNASSSGGSPLSNMDSVIGNTYIRHYKIPHWAKGGLWGVSSVTAHTSAGGGSSAYWGSGKFIDSLFTVLTNLVDTIPPTISSLNVNRTVAHRGDTLTFTVEISDTGAGYNPNTTPYFSVHSPANQKTLSESLIYLGNNKYSARYIVSEYAGNGPYLVGVTAADFAENRAYSSRTLFTVVPDGSLIIKGNVRQSTGAPLANSKVFLVKQNADSLLYVMRVAKTDTAGNYLFYSEIRDSLIYLKAIPDPGLVTEVPTYLDTAVLFAGARLLHIDTTFVHVMDTFKTTAGTNTGWIGFIIGHVSQGAGKTAGVGDPVANLSLVLVDEQDHVVAGSATDSTGKFVFVHLLYGTYRIFADLPTINNQLAPAFSFSDSMFAYRDLHLSLHDRYLEVVVTGIDELEDTKVSVSPNPSNGKYIITLDATIVGNYILQIYNSLGEIVSTQDFVADGKNQHRTIDLSADPTGIYLAKMTTPQGVKTVKLVKE